MKAIIILPELRGVFHASLEIANRLSKKGYEIVYCSSSDLSEWLHLYPYSFVKLPSKVIPKSLKADFHLKYLNAIQDLNGDLFIVDLECPVYILTCLSLGKKLFILNQFLPIPTFADAPIPNKEIAPGESFLSQMKIRISWLVSRSKLLTKAVIERVKNNFKDRRSLLIKLGETMGLDKKDYLYSRTLLPGPFFFFSKIPVLYITAREMDFKHKLRQNEHYVGPMIFLDRVDGTLEQDILALEAIIKNAKKENKKLIYCSLSSYRAVNNTFLKKLVDAFSKEENWEILIGLGSKSQKPAGVNPENIHFFKWIPALKVLPEADCALVTAGFHTIHECIHFQVPMLTFSLGVTDQNGFQARIKYKKLGLTGNIQTDTSEDIFQKVKTLLEDQEIKQAIRKMKFDFDNYEKEQVFEKLILN
ncbi:hypothetical protein [Algoriphagus sp.]|uniref:glycosyltransferase n=1 Tax=Algoriphagus sp. TaxID=1872435 RepID=UPI0025D5F688|nr:hypothetical protein [Algoriphagus sp.]